MLDRGLLGAPSAQARVEGAGALGSRYVMGLTSADPGRSADPSPGAIDSRLSAGHSFGSPVDSARKRDHLVIVNSDGAASRWGQPLDAP